MANILRLDFEVFGKVQGVFFRKHTQAKGNELGLRGWVRNTSRRTVEGEMEGTEDRVAEMKLWLQNTGSPMSRIEKAVFKNEKQLLKYSLQEGFQVRKDS